MEQHDDEDVMYFMQEVGLNTVVCQTDSGVICNVMSIQDIQRVTGEADPQLDNSSTVLTCYANTQIILLGQQTLQCTYEGHIHCLIFQIVDLDCTPNIGATDSMRLGLIQVKTKLCSVKGLVNRLNEHTTQWENRLISGKITEDGLRQEFKDTLQGLGQIPGEVQLDVKDDAKPQHDPPRRVPIPLKKRKLQEALGDLPGVKIMADDILVYRQGQTETEARINHENLLRLF
ncbi:hypothetical protein PR048_017999 [Dryococelus australis]|uniref:Uncharacterized protein n=1 Tax=Dryococelus australis TaxID=614101 RepID=A0ABQ9HB24_9NEOP|nr:hypothetical protein PR048_017999 [Dryococelus australis]